MMSLPSFMKWLIYLSNALVSQSFCVLLYNYYNKLFVFWRNRYWRKFNYAGIYYAEYVIYSYNRKNETNLLNWKCKAVSLLLQFLGFCPMKQSISFIYYLVEWEVVLTFVTPSFLMVSENLLHLLSLAGQIAHILRFLPGRPFFPRGKTFLCSLLKLFT